MMNHFLSTSIHEDPVFGDFYQEFRIKAESVPLLPWRWRWADVRVSLSRSSKGFPCETNLQFSAPSGLAQFKWGEAGRLLGRDPYVREQLLPLPTRCSKYWNSRHTLSGMSFQRSGQHYSSRLSILLNSSYHLPFVIWLHRFLLLMSANYQATHVLFHIFLPRSPLAIVFKALKSLAA